MIYNVGDRVLLGDNEHTITGKKILYELNGNGFVDGAELAPAPVTMTDAQMVEDLSVTLEVHPMALLSHDRRSPLPLARQAIFTYLRKRGWAFTRIGKVTHRTHCDVISGVRRFEDLMFVGDKAALEMYDKLTKKK